MSTSSFGKHGRHSSHIMCRRCGRRSFNAAKGICSKCGFGKASRRRSYSWQTKKAGKRAW
jgi:large subunit ribosomal protein L37e